MTSTDTILFVSHDASRTGAPILLLEFLRWFKANMPNSFEILLKDGGELEKDFCAIAPTWVLNAYREGISWNVARRLRMEARLSRFLNAGVKRTLTKRDFGLVYSNTIANGHVLEFLSQPGRPAITHVHELDVCIKKTGQHNVRLVKQYTTRFITASRAVRDNLVANYGIAEAGIEVIHEFVPAIVGSGFDVKAANQRVREELGISEDSVIVGASGTLDWRKAPDLFIQVARVLYKSRPGSRVHFVWMGGARQDPRLEELNHEVRGLGLEGRMHFIGPRPNPLEYTASFDLFALTSREDPYPLVCLEAASVGKPILCFDGSGGEKEFVEDDCGFVVPYLDVEAMAERIATLVDAPDLRHRLGAAAKRKVIERHDVSVAGSQICRVIEDQLRSRAMTSQTSS